MIVAALASRSVSAGRFHFASIVASTEVVIAGGAGSSYERSVLGTSDGVHFRTVAVLPVGLRYAAVVGAGNLIFVVGGASAAGDVASIERIDLTAGTVRVMGHLPFALSHASGVSLDGRLIDIASIRIKHTGAALSVGFAWDNFSQSCAEIRLPSA